MAHYSIRPQAELDLDEYAAYIANDNISAALAMYDAAQSTYKQLAEFRDIGKPYTSNNPVLNNVRCFPIQGYPRYLIFYIPYVDHIDIIRVLNTSRDINNVL